ncbi:T9SS type A sorting domain-containing protein [Hymenobacter negativus]|uniref:T9SS type A sorting domain-containing protein n=1 Tax=Hymenobacter negativus TaxID=2795026 RepID=A0ABS3QDA2_9BACT|nr:T9SS type A sorting domain-containing protein [Hymenobacter negativus]MBO2009157.1 T9SS type A sorting domain-containing protein [Hymenobacter negativus]
MKKQLYLSALAMLLAGSVQAQVTPEKVYQGQGEIIRLSNGDYKYQTTQLATNQVNVYNLNHSVYKQLTVPSLGTAYEFRGVQYVSDALFDVNANNVEYIAHYGSTNVNGGLGKSVVYSETGSQLAVLDSSNYYVSIYNTPAGAKMLSTIRTYSNSYTLTREYTRVYSLAGRLALRAATPQLEDASGAYPNPAQALVNLPYSLQAGQTGSLKVYDMGGRLVGAYQIDSHINRLEMGTRDLRAGVYTYTVETAAGVTAGKRFVIQ